MAVDYGFHPRPEHRFEILHGVPRAWFHRQRPYLGEARAGRFSRRSPSRFSNRQEPHLPQRLDNRRAGVRGRLRVRARAEGVEVPEYRSARERADRLIRDNPAPKFRGSLYERQAADDLAVSVSRKHCGRQARREQQKRRAKTKRA
jgi:hypothetical protein